MKNTILTSSLILISISLYSQKNWEVIPNEEPKIKLVRIENDTIEVKVLTNDGIFKAKKVVSRVKRITNEKYYGDVFTKTLWYLLDGKIVLPNKIFFEKELLETPTINPLDGIYPSNVVPLDGTTILEYQNNNP